MRAAAERRGRSRHARGSARGSHRRERPSSRSPDDRDELEPGDIMLLIVEDDPHYARILVDLARDNGLQGAGRRCAAPRRWRSPSEYQPTAMSLDVFLPDMLGWTVLSQLKQDPLTRHIPVQIVTLDEDRQHGLARGAFSSSPSRPTTEGLEAALDRIKDFTPAAPQAAAGGRGQRGRAAQHLASCSVTTTSRSSAPAPAQEALADAARAALRLRGARSEAAGHVAASRCWSR